MTDRRVYILPLVSIFIVAAFLVNPEMTGRIVGDGSIVDETVLEISGTIKISITDDIIPEESIVTVFLDEQSSFIPIKEFIEKSNGRYELLIDEIPEIGYEGYGYAGEHTYALELSEFDLDLNVKPGTHTLITEVSYENFVISSISQDIEV